MESEPKIFPLRESMMEKGAEPVGPFPGPESPLKENPVCATRPGFRYRGKVRLLSHQAGKAKKWIGAFLLGIAAAFSAPRWIPRIAPLLQESRSSSPLLDLKALVPPPAKTLAPGIPKDRVPEYTIHQFNYISAQGSERQWNLLAQEAFLYNKEKLVHARQVKAYLFNPDGNATVVTGLEAKYFMNRRDLEVFGKVKTLFPDGFELDSDYLRYKPNEKVIDIPRQYFVRGFGSNSEKRQNLSFTSHGFNYQMRMSRIFLPSDVHAQVAKPNESTILSDRCVLNREKQIAHFTMYPSRPEKARFVHVIQPTLNAKGRYADLNYGDFKQMLNYLTLHDDVLVRDYSSDSLRYSTSGQADFDAKQNLIILTKYPQVYQDDDTVTGDVILMHRDTDIVEVQESNEFSQGSP